MNLYGQTNGSYPTAGVTFDPGWAQTNKKKLRRNNENNKQQKNITKAMNDVDKQMK